MRFIYPALIFCALFSITFFSLFQPSAQARGSIEWELENSFRMFLDPSHTRMHIEEYENLTEEERKTPILSVERRLAKKYPHGWAEQVYDLSCWDDKKSDYRKCHGKKRDYLHPRFHTIIARLKQGTVSTGNCVWRVLHADSRKAVDGSQYEGTCGSGAKLEIPYPAGGIIEVEHQGKSVAQETIRIKDIFIVGLGDSFASGEGNPDGPVRFNDKRHGDYGIIVGKGIRLNHFPARIGRWRWIGDRIFARRKARWQSQACHRSLYSHQLRVALQLASENRKRAITFAGFACSGAEILVGLLDRYKGTEWNRYNPVYSQISSAALASCGPNEAEFNTYTTTFTYGGKLPTMENLLLHRCNDKAGKARDIDFLLVSIGGNDVGFARLVANTILRDKTALKNLGGWMGQVYTSREAEALLEDLELRYKAANRAFHIILNIPWKEADRIILTSYPKISYREDGKTICPDGPLGMNLHPVFNVNSKQAISGETFAGRLDDVMQKSASDHGWTYVSGHREQFAKHGYCAVNGREAEKGVEDFEIPRKHDGVWKPYNPSQYRAYQSRQRWIRTPNDVYMATHQHVDRILVRKVLRTKNLNQFQLIYAGTYGGSFHPTAEGQAAIADAVLDRMHSLLKKYKY